MKNKKQWKKSISLAFLLGVTALVNPSIMLAQQIITYDDGQVHQDNLDIAALADEDIVVNITGGSTWLGQVTAKDQRVEILLDGSQKSGGYDFRTTEVFPVAFTELTLQGGAEWGGDIQLTAAATTIIQLSGDIADSTFTGDILGKNASVGMGLVNSQLNGDIALVNFDNGSGSSGGVNVSVFYNSGWQGNLTYTGSGDARVALMESEWIGNYEKNVLDGSEPRTGDNVVNILNLGKWTGDYTVHNQIAGATLGMNAVSIEQDGLWNGNYKASEHNDADNVRVNYISVLNNSTWNGNLEISGNSQLNQTIAMGGKWNGDFTGKDIVLDASEEKSAGNLSIFGSATWTGAAKTNTENAINLSIFSESTWEVTADSTIRNLNLDGTSKIDFVNTPILRTNGYSTMTVLGNTIFGDGAQINLRTNLAQNTGDLLDIKGTIDGKALIGVGNQGSASVDPSKELTIIKTVASAEDTFALTHEVEVGGFKYMMKQDGTNWVLYSMDRLPVTGPSLTSAASGAINTLSAGYLLNYAENESVLKRVGELREGSVDRNIWGRIYGGEYGSAATGYVGSYDMNYQGVQIGADKKIALKNNGDLFLGIMGGYSKGNLDYKDGSGSIDSKTLGIYGTYVAPSDFYSNLILKYGWTNSDFSVRDSAGEGVAGKGLKSDGFSSSLEVGKKIHFDQATKSGWYVEPQAQITYGAQNGGSVTATNGLIVDLDGYHSLQGRLGMRAGYEVKSGKNPVNVYGKLSYIHEFDGKMDVALNGINIREELSDSWWNYGIGVTAKVGDRHNVYLEVEKSSGDRFDQKWGITGGYRVSW